jgi:hypothetical protein
MNEALAESLTMAGVILARTFGQQRFFLDRFTYVMLITAPHASGISQQPSPTPLLLYGRNY